MSAARNDEAKRVTSIARAINWSYMWRRLVSYVWLDLLLLLVAAAILVYGYNQTLPDGRVYRGMDPRRRCSQHVADPRARLEPDHAHLYRRARA